LCVRTKVPAHNLFLTVPGELGLGFRISAQSTKYPDERALWIVAF